MRPPTRWCWRPRGRRRRRGRHVIFCAGIQADRLARMAGLPVDFAMVPFRGEYYDVVPGALTWCPRSSTRSRTPRCRSSACTSRRRSGGPQRGAERRARPRPRGVPQVLLRPARHHGAGPVPRDVPAGAAHLRTGVRELRNSLWKTGYLRECQKYAPGLAADDLVPREAGSAPRRCWPTAPSSTTSCSAHRSHPARGQCPVAGCDLALPIGRMLAGMGLDARDCASPWTDATSPRHLEQKTPPGSRVHGGVGAACRNRTDDLVITSDSLYRLS